MTEHPLLSDLEAQLEEIEATYPEPEPEPDDDDQVEREGKTGHGDRGIPLFDGARGIPGGATIPGTRPGDTSAALEKANRDVARSGKRTSKTGATRPPKTKRTGNGPDVAHFPVRRKRTD